MSRLDPSPTRPRWARLVSVRDAVRRVPGGWLVWRIGVTLVGLVVIVIGALLIPLPGPGWLIVFIGLGIWSTEYAWARRLSQLVRREVGRWWTWLAGQLRWVQLALGALGLAFTAAVSVTSWYLF